MNLNDIPFMHANKSNYNNLIRNPKYIKFIVVHYTSNVNDTAVNNCKYFRDNAVSSGAHFFVDDSGVMQSVELSHAAYSVGLGKMKQPYIPNPEFYKICTNSNSVSVELCGSKTSNESSDKTKDNGAKLVAALMKELNIPITNVIRHYDVTGKPCPKWAVDNYAKWIKFKENVMRYYDEKEDIMLNNAENYEVFKAFMDRYMQELAAAPSTWETSSVDWAKKSGLMNGERPKSYVTRGELATVLERIVNK